MAFASQNDSRRLTVSEDYGSPRSFSGSPRVSTRRRVQPVEFVRSFVGNSGKKISLFKECPSSTTADVQSPSIHFSFNDEWVSRQYNPFDHFETEPNRYIPIEVTTEDIPGTHSVHRQVSQSSALFPVTNQTKRNTQSSRFATSSRTTSSLPPESPPISEGDLLDSAKYIYPSNVQQLSLKGQTISSQQNEDAEEVRIHRKTTRTSKRASASTSVVGTERSALSSLEPVRSQLSQISGSTEKIRETVQRPSRFQPVFAEGPKSVPETARVAVRKEPEPEEITPTISRTVNSAPTTQEPPVQPTPQVPEGNMQDIIDGLQTLIKTLKVTAVREEPAEPILQVQPVRVVEQHIETISSPVTAYSVHQENLRAHTQRSHQSQRHAQHSRTQQMMVGNSGFEDVETVMLEPIGRGVHDLTATTAQTSIASGSYSAQRSGTYPSRPSTSHQSQSFRRETPELRSNVSGGGTSTVQVRQLTEHYEVTPSSCLPPSNGNQHQRLSNTKWESRAGHEMVTSPALVQSTYGGGGQVGSASTARWETRTGPEIFTSPTVVQSSYSGGGQVGGASAARWETRTGQEVLTSPTVVRSSYSGGGQVGGASAARWETRTGPEIFTSPTVVQSSYSGRGQVDGASAARWESRGSGASMSHHQVTGSVLTPRPKQFSRSPSLRDVPQTERVRATLVSSSNMAPSAASGNSNQQRRFFPSSPSTSGVRTPVVVEDNFHSSSASKRMRTSHQYHQEAPRIIVTSSNGKQEFSHRSGAKSFI